MILFPPATHSTPFNPPQAGYRLRFLVRHTPPSSPNLSPEGTAAFTVANLVLQAGTPAGGILQKLFKARDIAVPPLATGPLTQAQARALLLSDDPTPATPVVLTSRKVPRARCDITARRGIKATQSLSVWAVDANVDASGRPVLEIRATRPRVGFVTPSSPNFSPDEAYVEVRFQGSQDDR